MEFESFFPGGGLREYVPIEMIFRCRNTGSEAISPYAEVTVSGGVYDADDNIVLKVDDKKYRIYNFWPGDRSGKLRLYIGSLKSGSYNLKLIVNTFNRVKNSNVSTSVFERPITVQ